MLSTMRRTSSLVVGRSGSLTLVRFVYEDEDSSEDMIEAGFKDE